MPISAWHRVAIEVFLHSTDIINTLVHLKVIEFSWIWDFRKGAQPNKICIMCFINVEIIYRGLF